jgi:hypothetical protein
MALTFPSNPVVGTTVGNYVFDGVRWKVASVPVNRLVNGSYSATLDSSGVFTAPSDATIVGNLTVSGGTTYVSGSNTVYTDNLIELHAPSGGVGATWTSNDGKDIGFRFHYYDTSDKNAALVLAQDTGYLEWYKSGTETSGVFTGTYGVFKSAGIVIAPTGSITFPDATNQTTAWTGTAAAGTLTGTTINATVVNSSLTSVGTLTDLTVTNTITGSISGNAATVTNGVYTAATQTLTSKTINGNDNTLSNIANSSLTNSSITINGSAISLGGSTVIHSITASGGLTGTLGFDASGNLSLANTTKFVSSGGLTIETGSTGSTKDWTFGTTGVLTFPDTTTQSTAAVQSNWNQTDNTKLDYIKNKPTSLGGGSSTRMFNLFGLLVPTTGTAKWFPHTSITITKAYLSIGVMSASDVVLQVRINTDIVGTFTLSANSFRSTTQTINLTMATTDYMTADLLTTGGENLTLTLEYNT